MKKPNREDLIIPFFFLILLIVLFIPVTSAHPGYGDCKDYHGITYIIPYYEKNAEINLDGIPTESFWTNHDNSEANGSLIIPLAFDINGPDFSVVYLNITFVISDSYLYILAAWKDNTTKPDLGFNIYDGLYFCWNISVSNFSAYFDGGMDTAEMGGGDADSWDWTCMITSPPNGSSYLCNDLCFGTTGWYDSSLEIDNVEIAYTYKTNKSYTVEIRRKLVTDEKYDIQFFIGNKNPYLFNMAIMQDGTHEDHAASWTYALDLENIQLISQPIPLIPGFSPLLLLSVVISILGIKVLIIHKKIKFD
ncbi:MAG: hypothetical protein ACTSWY_08205 [Promethearchaeota archaeon]